MANDYSSLSRLELESTLNRLKEELEDLEETANFILTIQPPTLTAARSRGTRKP